MRRQFVECAARKTAKNRCPWADKIVKCGGGYMAFESATDYNIWKNQK